MYQHTDEQLQKIPTPRLLNMYKRVRQRRISLSNIIDRDLQYDEITDPEFMKLNEVYKRIKAVLSSREHVERC